MNEQTKNSNLQIFILILVCINMFMTGYLILQSKQPNQSTSVSNSSTFEISSEKASAVATPLVEAFNKKDIDSLYMQFSELARLQVTKQKVQESVEGLYPITGQIKKFVFSHVQPVGEQDGKKFVTLLYKLQLEGGTMPIGELKITVVVQGETLSVYGFFINAQLQ